MMPQMVQYFFTSENACNLKILWYFNKDQADYSVSVFRKV